MPKTLKKLSIFTQIEIVDWVSFNQIYTPILSIEVAHLYISIYYQKQIFNHLDITSYDLDVFLNNLNTKGLGAQQTKMNFDIFKERLWMLEELNLAQVSIKNNSGTAIDYCVRLLPPLSTKDAINDFKIKDKLKKSVTQHKFEEICLLADDNGKFAGLDLDLKPIYKDDMICDSQPMEDDVVCDSQPIDDDMYNNDTYITHEWLLDSPTKPIKQSAPVEFTKPDFPVKSIKQIDTGITRKTKHLANISNSNQKPTDIDKNIYYEFYNGIFQKTGNVFVVAENILQIIKYLHLGDEKIPIEKLQYFAINSLKQKNKKHYICEETFEYLINADLNADKGKFSYQEYKKFWLMLLKQNDQENQRDFTKLFSQHSTVNFYAQIIKKDCHPVGLEKWINDCVKNKNFSFDILNAMISFVKVWTQKIPINYLIKFSNTLYNNDLLSTPDFLLHIKSLIRHDIKNGNRLNIHEDQIEDSEDEFDTKIFA